MAASSDYSKLESADRLSSPERDEYYYSSSPPLKRRFGHAVAYAILILMNIALLGLWLKDTSRLPYTHQYAAKEDSVRPKLIYCDYPFRLYTG